jgi:hypothetical protein
MPALLAAVAVVQFATDGNSVTPMTFTVRAGCTIPAEISVTTTFEDIDGIGGFNYLVHNPNLTCVILFCNTQ